MKSRRIAAVIFSALILAPGMSRAQSAAAHAFAQGNAEGWAELPTSFFSGGSARMRLESGGHPLPLEIDKDPSWSGDGTYEQEAAPRLKIRFRRSGSGGESGSATALLLSAAVGEPLTLIVEASFRGFESALPARFTPRGSEDVVFLGLRGSGADAAAGLYDPVANRGVDLGQVHEVFGVSRISAEAGGGGRLRIEGRVPHGKEVAFFSWKLIASVFPRKPAGTVDAAAVAAASFAGWSLPGGSGLIDRAEKILQASPIPPGAYLEIGDGWQGKRGGKLFGKQDRSWLPAQAEPPGGGASPPEIAVQVGHLRRLEFRPGLWIVPHGQSEDEALRRSPDAFVRDKKGKPIPGGFLGSFVVDGTSKAGIAYLIDLFRSLRAYGVSIFRIGGLRDALWFYTQEGASLSVPGRDPVQVLKDTIQAIRDGCGEGVVLAGDWDTPEVLAGLLDAARPSVLGTQGIEFLRQEGLAAARGYFRHRGSWLAECFPVTSWAEGANESESRDLDLSRILFAAITGRGLVVDRSVLLPVWAPGLLRSAWPPVPVRPIDLFPAEGLPRVWDLKLPDGGDLTGIFNWTSIGPASIRLAPRDLGGGRDEGQRLLFFDVLDETFAGASPGPRDFFLLPGRSRLLAIHPDLGRPQLIAAAGHFLATATDVEDCSWDATRRELRGRVLLPPSESGRVEMRIHIACGPRDVVLNAEAPGGTCQFSLEEGHLTLTLGGPGAARLPFHVTFASSSRLDLEAAQTLSPPRDLRVTFEESERRPLLEWKAGKAGLGWWRGALGFAVLRDGKEIARTTDSRFLDADVVPGERINYSVAVLPSGAKSAPVLFSFPARKDAFLDEWVPKSFTPEGGTPSRRRSTVGGPLTVGGKKFARGIGVRAPSKLEYRLDGAFAKFEASLGVDDAARFQGSVAFVVSVDGVEKFRSSVIRGGGADPRLVSVPVAGGQVLALIVDDAGDGADGDFADWGDARVVAK